MGGCSGFLFGGGVVGTIVFGCELKYYVRFNSGFEVKHKSKYSTGYLLRHQKTPEYQNLGSQIELYAYAIFRTST
jgi:hypothetical protein